MNRAYWMIVYNLVDIGRDEYLDWFHNIHIPEKLARKGYNTAAHYEVQNPQAHRSVPADGGSSVLASCRYIAVFGGDTTATFFDPSPLQLKLTQDDQTRDMIGRRVDPLAFVFAQEWLAEGPGAQPRTSYFAPTIELELFDADQNDQDIGAWCAQPRKSAFHQGRGCITMHKLLASAGPVRHAALLGFADTESLAAHHGDLERRKDGHVQSTGHRVPTSTTLQAARLWPEH